MVGITFKHSPVSAFCSFKLLLLLIDVPDLKPDVFFRQWSRRVGNNVFEAIQTLVELLLLFINYAKTEVDFIGLLERGLHTHHLREGFFGVFQRPVTIVKNAYSIPQLGFLGIRQMVEGLLIG